jgi:hypothetical protein
MVAEFYHFHLAFPRFDFHTTSYTIADFFAFYFAAQFFVIFRPLIDGEVGFLPAGYKCLQLTSYPYLLLSNELGLVANDRVLGKLEK